MRQTDGLTPRSRVGLARRRRLATTTAAGLGVASLAALAVMTQTVRGTSIGLSGPASPPPATEASGEETDTSRRESDRTGDTVSVDEIRLPLGVIDAAGLSPNDLADVPAVDGHVTTAFADGDGGVVYQLAGEPRTIHWRRAGGRDDSYHVEPGPTTLFGVVAWRGAAHVVWGGAVPDAEIPMQTLGMYRGEGQTFKTLSTDLVVEHVEGVAVADDERVIISSCHVLCQPFSLDLDHPGLQTGGDVPTEGPLGEPRLTWGFHGSADGRLFTLSSQQPDRIDGLRLDEVTAAGVVRASHDVALARTIDAAALAVAADGSAALIELIRGGDTVDWLLVDELDARSPRIRTITEVTGRLVLLDDPPAATAPPR